MSRLDPEDLEGEGAFSDGGSLFRDILFGDQRKEPVSSNNRSEGVRERFMGGGKKPDFKGNKKPSIKLGPEVVSLVDAFHSIYPIVADMGMTEDSLDIFKKRYQLQSKITERLSRKFGIDTNNVGAKVDVSKISMIVSRLLSTVKDGLIDKEKEKELLAYFEDVADEILDSRKWWTADWTESASDSNAIVTLKVASLDSLIKINATLEKYPFCHNQESTAQDILDFVILKAKDVARSWEDDSFGLENRAALYISMLPLMTEIAVNVWISASKNKLDTVRSIEPQRADLRKFVVSFLAKKGLDNFEAEHVCDGVMNYVSDKTTAFQDGNKCLDHIIFARAKQTVIGNIINMMKNTFIESEPVFNNELSLNKDLDKGSAILGICCEIMDDKIRSGGVMPIVEWGGFENIFDYNFYSMLGATKAVLKR